MLALAASRSASARASRRWLAPRRLAVGATASLRPQRPSARSADHEYRLPGDATAFALPHQFLPSQ